MLSSRRTSGLAVLASFSFSAAWTPSAMAGSFDLFGIESEYKLTLGYSAAMRAKNAAAALINGPVDTMQIEVNPLTGSLGSFTHTGLPTTANFDDGNRDFKKGSLLNNRLSAYGQAEFKFDQLGLGDLGYIVSGAAHDDSVYRRLNNHDSPATVNRTAVDLVGNRLGPANTWTADAMAINARRHRLLESYGYGQWNVGDMGINLRYGRHLVAWGESLFFPGIASAQAPFDATKANVPGAEVKEILLPVNQVSTQLALTDKTTLLGYRQFEFKPTEVFPEGDFFSPADLVGSGASFGYGSINPVSPLHCNEPNVTLVGTGLPAPPGSLCVAAAGFQNQPEYILTTRTADKLPGTKGQWGSGLKYAFESGLTVGAYYLRYNDHNPYVQLNMGYARVGDVGGTPVTTQAFGVRVPVSYTVGYADNIVMKAVSFSTVLGVLNVGGEITRRENVDTSIEATIAGVVAPVATRGQTTTAQVSALYVNNPGFIYDELAIVGEVGYTQVDSTQPLRNEDGICYSGTTDCKDFTQQGNVLFYDKRAWAMQWLVLPKARNVFPAWDFATPLTFSWLAKGTPSTPGVFGALYGDGDMRAGIGFVAQYLQNLELSLNYNAFFGDPNKNIGRSTLRANPYADHDYAGFNVKYNL